MLAAALAAGRGGDELVQSLDALEAPIYATDAHGLVSYFNPACTGFAGRTPAVGKDRWCVTWKLYTDSGDFLPHDKCPMAVAIQQARPVRGVTAKAERPDGTWVDFVPLPTPVFDADGRLSGAVNMLIDVTELRQIAELRDQARRCIRLAREFAGDRTSETLILMAAEYQSKATDLEGAAAANPYVVV